MKQNQKPCTKTKKVIDRRKKNKKLSEVKPDENISKKLQFSRDKSHAKRSMVINCETMYMSTRILWN